MRHLLIILTILGTVAPICLADQYVPEFNKMKMMKCEVVETTFDVNEKEISTTGYHRIFRLDDENNLIYLHKDMINGLMKYDKDKITFHNEDMTDNAIIYTFVEIDRNTMKYTSSSKIEYDNTDFEAQESVGVGECKYLSQN